MGEQILNTTPWFATSNLTSPEMRYALAALVQTPAAANIGSETGVFPAVSGLLVTTASSTSVSVAAGACVVQTPVGGSYVVTVPTNTPVTVTAQATNSRIDLVCVRVMDSEAGDGLGQTIQARLLTVEGTAAASPAVPTAPSGYLVLAQLLVNSSGITTTDKRQFTRTSGGVRLATANDTRPGSYPGDVRIWATGRTDVWTGSVWLTTTAPSAWTQENVPVFYSGASGVPAGTAYLGDNNLSFVRYKLTGKDLELSYYFKGGANWNMTAGNITTTLPSGFTSAARDQWLPTTLYVNGVTGVQTPVDWPGGRALVPASSNAVQPFFPLTSPDMRMFPWHISDAVGVPGASVPRIAGGYAWSPGSIVTIQGKIELA